MASNNVTSPSKLPLPADRRALLEARMQGINVGAVFGLLGIENDGDSLLDNTDHHTAREASATVGNDGIAHSSTSLLNTSYTNIVEETVLSTSGGEDENRGPLPENNDTDLVMNGTVPPAIDENKKRSRRKPEHPQKFDPDNYSNDGLSRGGGGGNIPKRFRPGNTNSNDGQSTTHNNNNSRSEIASPVLSSSSASRTGTFAGMQQTVNAHNHDSTVPPSRSTPPSAATSTTSTTNHNLSSPTTVQNDTPPGNRKSVSSNLASSGSPALTSTGDNNNNGTTAVKAITIASPGHTGVTTLGFGPNAVQLPNTITYIPPVPPRSSTLSPSHVDTGIAPVQIVTNRDVPLSGSPGSSSAALSQAVLGSLHSSSTEPSVLTSSTPVQPSGTKPKSSSSSTGNAVPRGSITSYFSSSKETSTNSNSNTHDPEEVIIESSSPSRSRSSLLSSSSSSLSSSASVTAANITSIDSSIIASHPDVQRLIMENQKLKTDAKTIIEQLQLRYRSSQEELAKINEALTSERETFQRAFEENRTKQAINLTRIMREAAMEAAQAARRSVADSQARLGKIVPHRVGPTVTEDWENGPSFIAVLTQKAALKARLEELEEFKKTVTKRNKKLRDSLLGSSSSSATGTKGKGKGKTNNNTDGDDDDDDDDDDTTSTPSDHTTNPLTSSLPGPFGLSSDLFGVGTGLTMGTLMGIATTTSTSGNTGLSRTQILAELELTESEEAVKVAIASVKRDLELLDERLHALEGERNLLMLELKRQKSERESRYKGHVTLGDDKRYLLLSLLGKGGFSEVWRALDLWEVNEVAIKIHQLNPHWGEEKKQSYVRHAMREYEIQSSLSHPHIVRLLQVIVMDADSFATVLEYCRGTDLEKLLKQHNQLPEREARAIVIQVLSALRYLNGYSSPWDVENNTNNNNNNATTNTNGSSGSGTAVTNASSTSSSSSSSASSTTANNVSSTAGNNNSSSSNNGNIMLPPPSKRKIIHYDLKPPNILFDEYRRVKVTDFGLSKIVDEAEEGASSMELTSQGAGTYWYLPPECFESGRTRISSKVDVWSIGVIFYQMLYGRKPFGEGQSQEQIMQQGTLTAGQIREVQFPPQPRVSDAAKNFIRRCLTVRQEARPDVLTICEDPYLRQRLAGTR